MILSGSVLVVFAALTGGHTVLCPEAPDQMAAVGEAAIGGDCGQRLIRGGQLQPGGLQLDLQTEIQNPQFKRLLDAGVDVGSAYLVLHQGELIPAAMQQVAQDVEQKLANKIAAGSSRPAENGMQPHGGAVVKNDVSTMTKKDRAEINRRVLAGEKISFS